MASLTLTLAGDTMLGRRVGEALSGAEPQDLFSAEVVDFAQDSDLFLLNLECCVSSRGEPFPDPLKPFFFRAPPEALAVLADLGVDAVTLANNHALDFGPTALKDTLAYLEEAQIAVVGAGLNEAEARRPLLLERAGFRLGLVAVSDHPAYFAAADGPGIAYADLWRQTPEWLVEEIGALAERTDAVLVTPHWGPNMVLGPLPHVAAAAERFLAAGATLVAGHSAHVFHGVRPGVLYDLGDFIDDYATSPLRNDLGLLFRVRLDEEGPLELEALPLKLDYCHTRAARGEEQAWVVRRFLTACRELGVEAEERAGRVRAPLR